jgi:myo-inositol-1(or 4)-monophosphatase
VDDSIRIRLELAIRVARGAGRVLLRHLGRLDGYRRKGDVDLVSAADHASQDYLLRRILRAFPDDGVLAEEGGDTKGATGFRWVVDPCDGTTNFVHGHPVFAVSVGVVRDGVPVAGCVHVPAMGETFHAAAGGGAFLNGRPIRVSAVDTLDAALLASGFPYYRRDAVDRLLALVGRAIRHGQGFRRAGAAAVDLCWLAAGRLDGFWEEGLHAWDVAAGEVIVREAGGRVTGFDGGPHSLAAGRTVASNGLIHDELRGVLFDGG